MMKTNHNNTAFRALASAGVLALATSAFGGTFVNGAFESGNLSGWTLGSGYLNTYDTTSLNPGDFVPSGSLYDASAQASAAVTAGLDANTDNHLNMVYSGVYSARVNNEVNDLSVNVLRQTVTNYTDSSIFFAWAAVLQASHDETDSDLFKLTLTDDTASKVLYDVSFSSASASSAKLFHQSTTDWFYTDWQVQNLDVSGLLGHTFTLSLLATDCPYGGHAGYVYLDGFGAVLPPPGPDTDPIPSSAVPEPSTYGLLGALGLGAIAFLRRRRKA